MIVSADSIYNEASIPRLVNLLRKCLRVGGVGLIAAKEYYAGVGGSVLALQKEISLWPDTLALDTEAGCVVQDRWSTIRHIVVVKRTQEETAPPPPSPP